MMNLKKPILITRKKFYYYFFKHSSNMQNIASKNIFKYHKHYLTK